MTEPEPDYTDFQVHLISGAMAGILEYVILFPVDTIKTRMQSMKTGERSMWEVWRRMVSTEGVMRAERGVPVIGGAAGPAHAVYFASYVWTRDYLTKLQQPVYVATGAGGAVATVLHDVIINPAEVIKQRLQMEDSPYKNTLDCFLKTYRNEGIGAFYRSFMTQLTMNIPFQAIHFTTYEALESLVNPSRSYHPLSHVVNGGVAGGVAAGLTTPLDVCKTLLNTGEVKGGGLLAAAGAVFRLWGLRGFFRGVSARIAHQVPSYAICWSAFEFFKSILSKKK